VKEFFHIFKYITPKFHFTLHSVLHIDNFSSLRTLNTLVFERMHTASRAFQAVIRNYTNSPLSIAAHVQRTLALDLLNEDYFRESFVLFRKKVVNIDSVPYGECLSNSIGCSNNSAVTVASRATIGGTEYHSDKCVVMIMLLSDAGVSLPIFGQVQACIEHQNELMFVVRTMGTVKFDKVRQAFLLNDTVLPPNFKCVYHKDLLTYQPFIVHSSDSCKYVIVRDSLPGFFETTEMRIVDWDNVEDM
jgi:hypothetical protein